MHHDPDWDAWIALLDADDPATPADRTRVVDRLAPAFAAHSRTAVDHVKHAFVPVLHHTKQLHDAISDDVLPRRTHALARLDDAGRRFDAAARRDLDATQSVCDDTERSLDALFAALDGLVRQSDLLFQTFRATMLEHVQRLRHRADQMPADVEHLVAGLDDKAKHLGATDHAKAKENLLRGILEKY